MQKHAARLADRARKRADYANDRKRLLAAASEITRKRYSRPLEAIPDLIHMLGFRLERKVLPDCQWALTDFQARTIWLCKHLPTKLHYRAAAPAVEAFTLAHELGHLRLHTGRTQFGEQEEQEADEYAGVFLVPQEQLVQLPAFTRLLSSPTQGGRSEQITRLALHFGVSRTAMLCQLSALGVVWQDPATGELKVVA
jgi:hypothetical protein